MNPSERQYIQVPIPPLSGDSALVFVNLLENVIHAIWQLHGEAMIDILNHVHDPFHRENALEGLMDDDLPF